MEVEDSVSVETQHVDLQAGDSSQAVEKGDEQRYSKMVHVQTQTWTREGQDKFTQMPVVHQSNQETQTDLQDDARDEKTQAKNAAESPQPTTQDDSAQTPLSENQADDGPPSEPTEEQNPEKGENPSAGTSRDPTVSPAETETKPKSYAKAVSGGGGANIDANKAADVTTKPSQSPR